MHVHVHVHIIINSTKSLVDGSLLNPPPSPASHLISSHPCPDPSPGPWLWTLGLISTHPIIFPSHSSTPTSGLLACVRECVSSILILLFHVPTTPPPQPGPRDTDWLSTVKPPWQSWLPGLAECLTLKQPSRLLGSLISRKLDPLLITTRSSSCPIIVPTLGDRYITALLPLTRLDSQRTPPALQHHQHSAQPTPADSWAPPLAPCPVPCVGCVASDCLVLSCLNVPSSLCNNTYCHLRAVDSTAAVTSALCCQPTRLQEPRGPDTTAQPFSGVAPHCCSPANIKALGRPY